MRTTIAALWKESPNQRQPGRRSLQLPRLGMFSLIVLLMMLVTLSPVNVSGFTFGFRKNPIAISRKEHPVQNQPLRQKIDTADNKVRQSAQKAGKNDNSSSLSTSLANYYLLWSPKFLRNMILSTLSLMITLRIFNWNTCDHPWLQKNLLFNTILPTLSSACCWIQLLLNAFTAMGCAGFNTYLGPMRPFFLSVLAYLTITTTSRLATPISTQLLRWTIALLPELLHIWNNTYFQRQKWLNKMVPSTSSAKRTVDSTTTTSSSGSSTDQNVEMRRVSIYLDCPTMGCVACINKIDSSLRNAASEGTAAQVEDAKSWLLDGDVKGGKAKVTLSIPKGSAGEEEDDNDLDSSIVSSVIASVEKAGFPCKVEFLQTAP